MRFFFRVEYDGSRYGGWQRQNNASSIQEALEMALSTVLRGPCPVVGAGRTDAGVHARAQGVHFDCSEPIDIQRCERSINSILPSDIAIYNLQHVDDQFHARYSALSRQYRYSICLRKCPLLHQRAWMLFYTIEWGRIQRAINDLKGTHDFATFCASGSSSDNSICTVYDTRFEKEEDVWVFTIEANRFIYKMVRSIVGTLIDIGRGQISESLETIIKSQDRKKAGSTAPPYGLVLEMVRYHGVQ